MNCGIGFSRKYPPPMNKRQKGLNTKRFRGRNKEKSNSSRTDKESAGGLDVGFGEEFIEGEAITHRKPREV